MATKKKSTAKRLDSILGKVNQRFKLNVQPADGDNRTMIEFRVSTGIPQLDVLTGGGLPSGRIVELTGEESAGKSSVLYRMIDSNHGASVLNDIEGSFEDVRIRQLGYDVSRLRYDSVTEDVTAEGIFDAWTQVMREYGTVEADCPLIFFMDSLAALEAEQEKQKKTSELSVAALARASSKGFKKVSQQLVENNGIVVAINQLRTKIGASKYEEQQDSPGGRALKFYASVRLFLKVARKIRSEKKKSIKFSDGTTRQVSELEGVIVRIKSIKNKVFRPYLEAEFCIYFDSRGIVWESGFVDFLLRYGVIENVFRKPSLFKFSDRLSHLPFVAQLGETFDKQVFYELIRDPDGLEEIKAIAIERLKMAGTGDDEVVEEVDGNTVAGTDEILEV